MSGIETVRIIVDAEKVAAKMIADAQAQAATIRKGLESKIEAAREELLQSAKTQAAAIVEQSEKEGKTEGQEFERNSQNSIHQIITRASTQKTPTVTKLVALMAASEN
jgi:F0F1-type ATP synthase membrane subunit b/b'